MAYDRKLPDVTWDELRDLHAAQALTSNRYVRAANKGNAAITALMLRDYIGARDAVTACLRRMLLAMESGAGPISEPGEGE